MDILSEADLLTPVAMAGFQPKNGVVFTYGERQTHFDFRYQYKHRSSVALQVDRAHFDQILAEEVIKKGQMSASGNRWWISTPTKCPYH